MTPPPIHLGRSALELEYVSFSVYKVNLSWLSLKFQMLLLHLSCDNLTSAVAIVKICLNLCIA